MPTTLTLQPTGQVLTVPTSWFDVTLAQFVALEASEPDDERRPAEILLGLAAYGLDQLAADDVRYIANLIDFANEPEDVYELHPTPGLPEVGGLPWGTLLMAQQHFSDNPEQPWLRSAAYLLALYRVQMTYGKYDSKRVATCEAALLESPCTEVLADCFYIFEQLTEVTERHAPDPEDITELDDDEIDAGAEFFSESFGAIMGLDAAAQGSVLKYDAVLQQDADTILTKLRMDGARSAFQRRLSKLRNSKNSN
jgi:hypothetical protein